MEKLSRRDERVAVRVELESLPLKGAPLPPSRLQTIAASKSEAGVLAGVLVLYIGTDSGYLLRYVFSQPLLQDTPFKSPNKANSNFIAFQPSIPPLSLPSSPSPFNPSSLGPIQLRSQLPYSSTLASSPVSHQQFWPPRPSTSSPSSPSAREDLSAYSPFASSPPPFVSVSGHGNGNGVTNKQPSENFLLSPLVQPSSPVSVDTRGLQKTGVEMSLTACKHVAKSPVEALCPLPESGRLAFLCEGQVSLLNLESLSSLERIPGTKGTTAMARDINSRTVRLNSASRNSLKEGVFDESSEGPRTPVGQDEVTEKLSGRGRFSSKFGGLKGAFGEAFAKGMESPGRRSGRFGESFGRLSGQTEKVGKAQALGEHRIEGEISSKLAVAVKKKILLFEIRPFEQDKDVKTIQRDGFMHAGKDESAGLSVVRVAEMAGVEGVVTMVWLGDVIIAGTRQEYILFSLASGQATHLFSLSQEFPWRPLLKAFPKDGEALLLIDNAGIPMNMQGTPAGGGLQFQIVPEAVGQCPPYVIVVKQGLVELYHRKSGLKMQSLSLSDFGKGSYLVADDDDGTFVVIANASKVWVLQQVPLDEQVLELLKQKIFEEALLLAEDGLAEAGDEKAKRRLNMVHAEVGFLLLFDLRFDEAVDHFLLSDMMEPAELFPFFPSLTSRWRALVPRKRYLGLHPPPQPMQMVIESGLLAIQSGLLEQSLGAKSDGIVNEDLLLGITSSRNVIVDQYLTLAMQNVARYLGIARDKDLKPVEKEGVDTLLMKLFAELNASSELEHLASSSNSCVLEELESLLKGLGQLRALALLYESKMLWGLALDVWQTLAEANDGLQGKEGITGHLSALQLTAAREAARLLEALSDSGLVLHHISWILKLNQDMGLSVLTSSKRAQPLPPDGVLAHLESVEGMAKQRYLLWLVQDQGSKDFRFHTELALSLAKSSLSCMVASRRDEKLSKQYELHSLGFCSGPSGDSANSRELLLPFLESSDIYDVKAVLDLIQESQLWQEQFVLHRKLGDEISALRTLALKLQDYDAAEHYCAEIGRPEAYLQLMDMYLKPGAGKEPMSNAAVRLLLSHGACLDPLQVLEALSLEMPLHLASETIAQMLLCRVHRYRQGQIVKQLVRADNLEARIARVEERSRHVSITAESACQSCQARIGTKPFVLYPDNSILCYKCLRRIGGSKQGL